MSTLKVFKALLFSVLCIFFIPNSTAQVSQEFEKNLEFDGEEIEKTIPVNISDGTTSFHVSLEGEISKGALFVKLFDPAGNEVNGFTLKAEQSSSKGEGYAYEIHTTSSDGKEKNKEKKKEKIVVRSNSNSNGNSNSNSNSSGSGTNNSNVNTEINTTVSGNEIEEDVEVSVFSVSSESAGDEMRAKGVFQEEIESPMNGAWKIVIQSDKALGKMDLEIRTR